jgi:hypothetical protein
MGKPWENHRKTMGKPWETICQWIGLREKTYRKTMKKTYLMGTSCRFSF